MRSSEQAIVSADAKVSLKSSKIILETMLEIYPRGERNMRLSFVLLSNNPKKG